MGLNAIVSKNRSTSLDEDAKKTSKKIPELEDWLKRLEDLIKKIRNNFQNANKTLAEVKKPFTKFDNLTETIGMCIRTVM